jgi:hypothetical protein
MIETALVYAIVLLAALYAAWKFAPAGLRQRLVPGLVRIARRRFGLSAATALRLESKLVTAGTCGSCNSCNACATDPHDQADALAAVGELGEEAGEINAVRSRVIPILSRQDGT